MIKEYLNLDRIKGPLVFLRGVAEATYGEIVEITLKGGEKRKARIIQLQKDLVVAQVFEGTQGMSTTDMALRFTGRPFEIRLSPEILGRVFNGVGNPVDGGGPIYRGEDYNINGRPINPVAREYPRDYIQTGISSIDLLTTLIKGQKLPIFSGSGLPHKELAAQIVSQATLSGERAGNFAVVFAAIGVTKEDAGYFKDRFSAAGTMDKVVMFLNYADDPIVERFSAPRCALTAAEYLAFEKEMDILVVMLDITSYCEALRELSSAREEVPSRKGYPGYLYSDLASLYERAGILKGKKGSITFLPMLTMPGDDITHPIPDLTGYITEGQIVLSRELDGQGIYPPVNILPSLSRLMKDGIGEGYTREDHPHLANQLFSAYSKVLDIRGLAQIIGEDDLSETDQRYMVFGRLFEERFLTQAIDEDRGITESLDLGWDLLRELPRGELDRLSDELIEAYLKD